MHNTCISVLSRVESFNFFSDPRCNLTHIPPTFASECHWEQQHTNHWADQEEPGRAVGPSGPGRLTRKSSSSKKGPTNMSDLEFLMAAAAAAAAAAASAAAAAAAAPTRLPVLANGFLPPAIPRPHNQARQVDALNTLF
jgi:hypothetical protein